MSVHISVLRRSATLAAPDAVFFRAAISDPDIVEAGNPTHYDESRHRLRYVWDFGDPGAASARVVNLPRAHNDLNTASGKEVAHVFRNPGRHVVTCTVYGPDGLIGQDSAELRVDDPARAFAGARTILLDPEGRGDAEHPEAQIARDWASAFAAASSGPGTVSRVLLRRGHTYTLQAEQRLTRAHGSIHIGAFGRGARPELRALSGLALFELRSGFNGAAVFQGIDLRGPWDATTETGSGGNRRIHGIRISQGNGRSVVIDDCTFDGMGNGVVILGDLDVPDPGLFVLHDCDITNWGDYGIFAGTNMGNHIAILGSAIHQHPQAMQGGNAKDGRSHNEHGPVRVSGVGHFHMDACDLFSRTGWTRVAEVPADQPCLRWNTKAAPGSAGTVSRTAMEGGFSIVSLRDENNNGTRFLSNFVMERCLLVGSASTIMGAAVQFTGQTLRNNIVIMPDVPSASIRWQSMIAGQAGENPEGARDRGAPVEIYANTFLQRRSDAHQDRPLDMQRGVEEFDVFSFENNLFATPNTSQPGGEAGLRLGGGAIATVGGTWQPRFEGLKYQPERPSMDRRFATPGDQLRDLVPQPGTPGADDAMGSDALDDFFGNPRGATPDRGAIET